jgi:hypothetical protein
MTDRSMTSSSRTRIVILLAAAASAAAAFYLYAGRERPAGPRTIAFRDRDGTELARAPLCHGPVFADGRALWRTCETSPPVAPERPGQWHLARFDLERGVADLRWPLPPGTNGTIQALARHASGRLAAVLYEGHVVVAQPEGGLSVVGRIPDTGAVAGLNWVGDDLEVVPGGHGDTGVHRLAGGTWTIQPIPRLEAPPEIAVKLVMAERGPGGLALTYVRSSERPGAPLDVITRADSGQESAQSVQLPGGPDEVRFDIDGSPGNAVSWAPAPSHRTLERVAGTWRVAGPDDRVLSSDYAIEDGVLRWIPYALGGPVRIGGRWLDAAPHLLPIAGTTDLWALDRITGRFTRVDRDLAPALTRASTAGRGLAVAAVLLFPLALAASLVQRSRRKRAGQPAT